MAVTTGLAGHLRNEPYCTLARGWQSGERRVLFEHCTELSKAVGSRIARLLGAAKITEGFLVNVSDSSGIKLAGGA
ncbi:hypothetical protein D3C79_1091350 [compost metagenome]